MGYLQEMAENGYSLDDVGDYHRTMVPYLIKRAGIVSDDLVVDIGSASGHYLVPLFESGYKNLIAVDIDEYNFEKFNTEYGVKCYKANIETECLPLPDATVNAILAIHLIEHLNKPGLLLEESYRLLVTGGRIVFITPNWRKQVKIFWRDPTHVHPYDKVALARLVRSFGFKIEYIDNDGSRLGLDRLKLYRIFPWIGKIIGRDILLVATKK